MRRSTMAGEKYVWFLVLLLTILKTVTTGNACLGWGWRVHADNEAIVINRLHKCYRWQWL